VPQTVTYGFYLSRSRRLGRQHGAIHPNARSPAHIGRRQTRRRRHRAPQAVASSRRRGVHDGDGPGVGFGARPATGL